jgi:rhodanese-related sulfurtransferase
MEQLDVERVRRLVDDGAVIVDVRPIDAFAAGHIRGSLSIQLRDQFATWLGWLVDEERPVVFVLDPDQDRAEVVRQALKVGYERLAGELAGGIVAWERAGFDLRRVTLVPAAQAAGTIVDIRQDAEYAAGHIPGALHVELGALVTERVPARGPLTLMCGHGERAMSAASVLETQGHRELAVVVGGPAEWASATGRSLDTGR